VIVHARIVKDPLNQIGVAPRRLLEAAAGDVGVGIGGWRGAVLVGDEGWSSGVRGAALKNSGQNFTATGSLSSRAAERRLSRHSEHGLTTGAPTSAANASSMALDLVAPRNVPPSAPQQPL